MTRQEAERNREITVRVAELFAAVTTAEAALEAAPQNTELQAALETARAQLVAGLSGLAPPSEGSRPGGAGEASGSGAGAAAAQRQELQALQAELAGLQTRLSGLLTGDPPSGGGSDGRRPEGSEPSSSRAAWNYGKVRHRMPASYPGVLGDTHKLRTWLDLMKEYHVLSGITAEEQRVRDAGLNLCDEAAREYATAKRQAEEKGTPLTWQWFEELLTGLYTPLNQVTMARERLQALHMQYGNGAVQRYNLAFNTEVQLIPEMATDDARLYMYKRGLQKWAKDALIQYPTAASTLATAQEYLRQREYEFHTSKAAAQVQSKGKGDGKAKSKPKNDLAAVVTEAVLAAMGGGGGGGGSGGGGGKSGGKSRGDKSGETQAEKRARLMKKYPHAFCDGCWECGEPGHRSHNCPHAKMGGGKAQQ